MRRLAGPCSVLAIVLAIAAAPSGARAQLPGAASATEQLTVDYSFEAPKISTVSIEGVEYDRVTMPGCTAGGTAGEPALPACGAQILIPLGRDVASVEIAGEPVLLGDGYLVEPLAQPVRLSAGADAAVAPTPDPAIYGAPGVFPARAFEQIGVHGFRGYQILTLKLHPVVYVPATGTLSYYPQLAVTVNMVETGWTSPLFRGLADDQQEVLTKVDNPAEVTSYPLFGVRDSRSYDLLIITTSTLAGAFQPLKTYHDAHGVATEIHTTAEIGGSDPDTIRAYITDRYNNDGISYVIIGADDDLIPAKDLYVEAWAGGDVEPAMPGDVFFACLDGTWNYDGDSRWGEPTDGPGGGNVDLVAEVYVGRACGGNTTEITRFVDKTIWYLNGGHTHPEKVQLVGEYLGFGGESDYAAGMMEQLIDGCSADGYTTVGIPSSDYVVDELFERDMSWSQSDLLVRVNAGVHLLNHLGHGSPDYAMKFYNSDISLFSNTDLCFVYSQTCLAGHFDGTDCWAEYMNIKTDNGSYALIMNARYGWGTSYSTDGPNQRFNREFYDAVYGEGKMELGRANHDSKEDNLYRVNDSCMRWCYYEINLFGDPTVAVRGVAGLSFSYPGGIPETVLPGETTVIEVVVSGTGDGIPVTGSGQLHYSIDGGGYVAVDMYEVSANHYEATLPALSCGSTIAFYFTAEEAVNGTFSDPADAPSQTYSAFPATGVTTAFADNFETDQGWVAENLGATSGDWQRGVPVNDPGWDYDPASDSDGSGRCYLTQNVTGNTDVDDGSVRLTSPTIDMSSGGITISYDYYLYLTNSDGTDRLLVEINNNGGVGTWFEIARHDTNGGLSWRSHTIDQSDLDAAGVTLTANMKIRFTANDGGTQSIVEAGIDAFQVVGFSCEEGDQYTLTVNVVGNGDVTRDPDQATYTYGQNVELTANADPGWTFDHWSGDLGGSTNPDTITMDGDKTVTAHFVQDEYTLTVNIVGNGDVTLNPDQATYTYGQNVELTANADPWWQFDHWEEDLTGSSNPETLLMDGDKTVTAVFVITNDCNDNAIPDEEDLADCDGSPWCSDCNGNGVLDVCDIDPSDPDGNGEVSADLNGNGIPDECEIPGDLDEDGDVDIDDFNLFATCMNGPFILFPFGCDDADLSGDSDVDLADFAEFQMQFTGHSE